jgi:predicted small metal-binding protein
MFLSISGMWSNMTLSGNSEEYEYKNMDMTGQEAPVMSFCCKDIGMDCSFEAQGSSKHELMKKFIDHAESTHNMQVLSADIIFNVHNAIIKRSY